MSNRNAASVKITANHCKH